MAKCSADEAQSKKSIQDFFDKLSSYQLRKEKIFGERVVQQLRDKEPFSWEVLSRLCVLLECQPGDLLESVPNEREAIE